MISKLIPKNKKGQIGLNVAKNVFVAFLVLAVIAVTVILALVSLQNSGIFTTGSQGDNSTRAIVGNVSTALTDNFFDQTGTIFAIIIVVVIILALAIIIGVVTRFGGATGGGL